MENKQSDLEQFLKRLERCGDLALAAQRAGVSNEQFEQWFKGSDIRRKLAARVSNDYTNVFKDCEASDILNKIALARYKGLFRKSLRTPLMEPMKFAKALRYCYNYSTKRGSRNDTAIINLLIKNPKIKDRDGARKLKISIAAYKMRKKRMLAALFKHLTIR